MKADLQEAYRLLHEGSLVLSRIEAAGVRVNADYVNKTETHIREQIRHIQADMKKDEFYRTWHKRYGDKTNLGSYEQIGNILFNVMGYESKERTATGRVKTDADALEDIEHPFVKKFQKVQHHKKTLDTYLCGIKREMVKERKCWMVHPIYNLHTASTYRSSCDNPNFQNVPKRNPEMANLIRPSYLPHPGHHIVEIDFGQLEVRVAKCYNKDPVLGKYIKDKTTDMHRDTAMKLFLLKKEEVFKKTTRDSAKNEFVFPEFYGSVYFNCAKNIWKSIKRRDFRVGENGKSIYEHLAEHGITERGACIAGEEPVKGTFEAHVKEVEEWMWHEQYKVYTEWKRKWFADYQKTGGFAFHTGFYVSGVLKRNDVINYPIQGSAFHCLLWCLIQIDAWLRKYKMRSRIIGEIHDSMIASVHPAELQDFLNYSYHVMTVALLKHWRWIDVPMEVEADVGPVDGHWMTSKLWVPNNGNWSLAS